jgi:hypothetical protein
MLYSITHDPSNTADAIDNLVKLSCDVESLSIAGNFDQSHGNVRDQLDQSFAQLEAIRQAFSEVIFKTRQYIGKLDASLAAADAQAQKLYQ